MAVGNVPEGGTMKKLVVVALAAAMVLTMSVGVASASPSTARNYEEIPAECQNLGLITIGIAGMGMWAAAKVVGTRQTLIPRWFDFEAVFFGEDGTGEPEVVFGDSVTKRNARVDDVCTFGERF